MLPVRAVLGQTPDEDKKLKFLKAREEMKTLPMTPAPENSPKPKPKPKPVQATPTPEPATPKPRQKPEPEPEATPKPRPKPEATPRPPVVIPPKPAPQPPPRQPAPLLIEESAHGYQPAPPAGWFEHWKYLTPAVRSQIDHAPVLARRWRYIVVHNSGTRQGNAKAFDYYHLHVRRMPNGLAYHFVIGNGTSTGDGEIEIGNRWRRQINGGHVHSDYLNSIALGICLVGDFNRDLPTNRQLGACEELIRYLRQRVGQDRSLLGHREAAQRNQSAAVGHGLSRRPFPYQWLHGRFDQPGT